MKGGKLTNFSCMKKVVFLLSALSVFSVAKTAIESESNTPADSSVQSKSDDSLLKDSTYTLYVHPLNFIVPYSHFWAGVYVPNGFTDYPLFNLTFEWMLMEKISLVSMPHYVRVDRKRKDDRYKIYDIGLQESFRLYGVGGQRWRYFQAGLLMNHLHIHSNRDGGFDGWLFGLMFNGGVKKILNGGEGFLGRFAVSVDVGLGYVWVSDFDADRKGKFFEMDKDFVIDVNAAIGFQI